MKAIVTLLIAAAGAAPAAAITLDPILGAVQTATIPTNPPPAQGCLGAGALTPDGGTLGSSTGHAGTVDTGGSSFPVYASSWEFDLSATQDQTVRLNLDWQLGQGPNAGFCVIEYQGDGTMSGDDYLATRTVVGTFSANDTALVGGMLTHVTQGHISMVIPNMGGIMGIQIVSPLISGDRYFSSVSVDTPEPAMLGLFGLGAIGLGLSRRRR